MSYHDAFRIRCYWILQSAVAASFTFLAGCGAFVRALCQVPRLGEGGKRGGTLWKFSTNVPDSEALSCPTLPGCSSLGQLSLCYVRNSLFTRPNNFKNRFRFLAVVRLRLDARMKIGETLRLKCISQSCGVITLLEISFLSFELKSRWKLCINGECCTGGVSCH